MIVGLRGGHSPNCKGAMGLLDEQMEVRKYFYEVKKLLEQYGHTVIDCNSNASNVSTELKDGTNKANNNKCDIYITIHMNSFNGAAQGTEAWCYNKNSGIANTVAERFVKNMASIGYTNRGVKYSTGYHDLKASSMPAIILETFFCDNRHDVDIWNKTSWDKFARIIANAIDPNISLSAPIVNPPSNVGKKGFRCVCGTFTDRANAEAQQRKLKEKGFDSFLVAIDL